jgi:coenzyme F420-dependent glucose-6-phosphate dehydrogenase
MVTFGIDLNMDLWHVNDILEQASYAEKEGFDNIWFSDHFHPWLHRGAHEGFAWVALAAAGQRTYRAVLGTCVTAPILRYHPAIVAQAFATLQNMYPKRIILGLGLGEAMNEVPLGYNWPDTEERIERFIESIKIMKLLWTKPFVEYKGKYYTLRKANLYDRPVDQVPIYIASWGPLVTRLAGKYADGYITGSWDYVRIRDKLLPALEEGAKESGRDPKSIKKVLGIACSFDENYEVAEAGVARVAANLVPGILDLNVYDPRKIEALGRLVDPKDYRKLFTIATEPEPLIKKAEEYIPLGFSHIYYINFGSDQMKFIEVCGRRVIPALQDRFSKNEE